MCTCKKVYICTKHKIKLALNKKMPRMHSRTMEELTEILNEIHFNLQLLQDTLRVVMVDVEDYQMGRQETDGFEDEKSAPKQSVQ